MTLRILTIPNAKQNEIVGWIDGALKIRIAAPPLEGKANMVLIDFLAEAFDLSPSEITLEKGHGSKHKRISLPVTLEEIEKTLTK